MTRNLRIAVLIASCLAAIAVAAGVASAKTKSAPIGTGVVVIDTSLSYEGGEAAGTGMVLTSSGEILTNNHVIRGATSIRVVIPGAGRSYTAKVVGYDVTDDIAVLQLAGASNLKTVSISTSSNVRVGQSVKAVGNAGGTGSLVSAAGSVTGVGRAITVSDDAGGSQRLTGLIETDAALQPGDSGGPLFNSSGSVVGIDTAASVGYGFQQIASNDGYAIPIGKAVSLAKQIAAGKSSANVHIGSTAFLGVAVSSYYGSGVVVSNVVTGSPAAKAGLVPGDVITSVAGRSVSTPAALAAVIRGQSAGGKATVTYTDEAGAHTVTVTLTSGPPQ